MVAKKDKNLVPELRFPGFDGEWDVSKLKNGISFLAGYAFKSDLMSSVSGKYQLLKMSNVYQNELMLKRNPSFWGELDVKLHKFILKKDDVLLTLTGTVNKRDYGYSVKIPESDKFLINQRLVCLSEINGKSNSKFIRQLVLTERFYYHFFSSSKGGTGNQSNVSIEDLKDIELPTPSLPEQQKIASFLTAVDNKISKLTRKKELLEQYKRGVMQKIFSQEIRFKDENGKSFPDWEEKRLGDVLNVIDGDRGTNYPNGDDFSSEGYCLFLNAKNVTKKGFLFDQVSFISKEKDEVLRKGKLKKNDLILTTRGTVGNMAYYDDSVSYINMRINSGMVIIRNENRSISSNFIYMTFTSPYLLTQLQKIAFGSAQPQLTVKEINQFKLLLPSYPEQQHMASFLSDIDKKLESIELKLSQTQTFKKGLLQKLFI